MKKEDITQSFNKNDEDVVEKSSDDKQNATAGLGKVLNVAKNAVSNASGAAKEVAAKVNDEVAAGANKVNEIMMKKRRVSEASKCIKAHVTQLQKMNKKWKGSELIKHERERLIELLIKADNVIKSADDLEEKYDEYNNIKDDLTKKIEELQNGKTEDNEIIFKNLIANYMEAMSVLDSGWSMLEGEKQRTE